MYKKELIVAQMREGWVKMIGGIIRKVELVPDHNQKIPSGGFKKEQMRFFEIQKTQIRFFEIQKTLELKIQLKEICWTLTTSLPENLGKSKYRFITSFNF